MGIFDLHVLWHDHIVVNPSLLCLTFKSTCSTISSLGCLFKVQLLSLHMPLLTDTANNRIFDVWVYDKKAKLEFVT